MLSFSLCYAHTLSIIFSVLKRLSNKFANLWAQIFVDYTMPFQTYHTYFFYDIIYHKPKEKEVTPPTQTIPLGKVLQAAIDYRGLLSSKDEVLNCLSNTKCQPWDHIHKSYTILTYQIVFVYVLTYTYVMVIKKKQPSNWEGVRRSIGVVSGKAHGKGWKRKRRDNVCIF